MPYLVYRSDGIPLQEFDYLNVCRSGRFVKAFRPMVYDVFTIVTPTERVSYYVYKVDNFRAYTIKIARD